MKIVTKSFIYNPYVILRVKNFILFGFVYKRFTYCFKSTYQLNIENENEEHRTNERKLLIKLKL